MPNFLDGKNTSETSIVQIISNYPSSLLHPVFICKTNSIGLYHPFKETFTTRQNISPSPSVDIHQKDCPPH